MRNSLAAVAIAIFVSGCSGNSFKIAPVSGRITLNGKPLPKASVTFSPVAVGGNQEPGPSSTGKTDADGRYSLSLIGMSGSGAVVGKHKVRIALLDEVDTSVDLPSKAKQIPLKYNGQTILEFVVPADGATNADFELNVK